MADSPYELQRLVTIGTFSTPWEAQIAQARLSAEGLHSLIANEHVIRLVALSNAVGGVQLKVRERDAEMAVAVLRRLAPLPEIYLVSPDGAAAAAPSIGDATPTVAERIAAGPGAAPAGETAGAPVLLPASPAAPPLPEVAGAGVSCPGCGGHDVQPERSSRLVLGVLPVSRQGYRCGDCGVLWRADELGAVPPLSPLLTETGAGAPRAEEDTALATVARFHTPWEAHLARTFLESEGLRCCVLEERLPAVHLLSAEPVAYNRLEVRQADAARAAEFLARAWSYPALVALPESDPGDPGGDGGPGSDPDSDAE